MEPKYTEADGCSCGDCVFYSGNEGFCYHPARMDVSTGSEHVERDYVAREEDDVCGMFISKLTGKKIGDPINDGTLAASGGCNCNSPKSSCSG